MVLVVVNTGEHTYMRFSYAFVSFRNSAAQTVKQRLVFVGSEEGKILALRQIFNEVIFFLTSLCLVYHIGTALSNSLS